jgi:hypothetical protein
MCALDAVASYGYKNRHVAKFVKRHFPEAYKQYANMFYQGYRNSLVHSWNLVGNFALLSGNQVPRMKDGELQIGVIHFADAFERAVRDYLQRLKSDKALQDRTLHRYREVVGEIKRPKAYDPSFLVGALGFILGVATTLVSNRLSSNSK